ncbi:hypothetical protein [Litoreibacter halocynthiae]|uniref:hypothetical protein n=1 Tax=Litoreibacter halocynthiae TaxID=1242689 RepID=UPI002492A84C|nr:hypothetical protein [Litoreibacter halocynthiae]
MTRFTPLLFGACVAALSACVPTETVSRGSCDASSIGIKSSQFGLNYAALAPFPVAEILSQAEAEYIENADYFVVTKQATPKEFPAIWRRQVTALLKGPLAEAYDTLLTPSISFFRFLTPDNFQLLRLCAPADDPKLGYLTRLEKFPASESLNN